MNRVNLEVTNDVEPRTILKGSRLSLVLLVRLTTIWQSKHHIKYIRHVTDYNVKEVISGGGEQNQSSRLATALAKYSTGHKPMKNDGRKQLRVFRFIKQTSAIISLSYYAQI